MKVISGLVALISFISLSVTPSHHIGKVIVASSTTTIPVPTTSTTLAPPLVSKKDMEQWTLVAQCETHQRWHRINMEHGDGGLGILPWNWVHYGGLRFAPTAHEAEPEEQVWVAKRIQHGLPVPDQDGTCKAW